MDNKDNNDNLKEFDGEKKDCSSKVRLAVRISSGVFFALVMLYLIFAIILQVFFPLNTVNVLGYRMYLISYTGSMEPKFEYNDLILVKKYDFDKLEVGDIITFLSPIDGTDGLYPVTHQIEEIAINKLTGEKFLRTKGINLPLADLIPVTKDGVGDTNKYVGKYVFKSSFLGHLFAFLKSGLGLVTVIVNTVSIIGIYLVITKIEHREVNS